MRGSNTLKINGATMIEAMQYWLASQMVITPVVKGVTYNAGDYTFDVALESLNEDEK